MLRNCNYDAACAQQYDDRAHMIKVLDTAARIVRKGKDIHGSWDLGVEYYRGPGHVGKNRGWRYLHDVKEWREGIQDRDRLYKAAEDFSRRNGRRGQTFDEYISNWHETSVNWGLPKYAARSKLARR